MNQSTPDAISDSVSLDSSTDTNPSFSHDTSHDTGIPAAPPLSFSSILIPFVTDCTTNGEFLLMNWGEYLAVGFRGDPAFVKRCVNWALNHEVPAGEIHEPFNTGTLAYILVDNREKLVAGLAAQFYGEIAASHEAPWKVEPRWETQGGGFNLDTGEADSGEQVFVEGEIDEEAVATLAAQRAEQFLNEVAVQEPFLQKILTSPAATYEIQRVEAQSEEE